MQDITVFKNDRTAVSPVIGVILMVAVTVIIAAVIGSTALGLGDSVSESPPQAQFAITNVEDDYEIERAENEDQKSSYGTAVVLEHKGGEDVNVNNIKVEVDGEQVYSYGTYESKYGRAQVTYPFQEATGDIRKLEGDITAGDQTTLIWYGSFGDDYTHDPQYYSGGLNDAIDYATWKDNAFYEGGTDSTVYPGDDEYKDFETGDTVRIVWESGDQSQTLFEEEL